MTERTAVWLSDPAALDAMHLYLPACLAATLSMLKKLTLLLVMILTSCLLESTGVSSNVHVKLTGKSPFTIVQETDSISPELSGSSPKENWRICGATARPTRKGKKRKG